MTTSAWVAATGVRTPLGVGSPGSAAAVRASISAVAKHPFMVDQMGDAISTAMDAQLDASLMGTSRMLGMAQGALHELSDLLASAAGGRQAFPVYLALPELRPGFAQEDADAVRAGLLDAQEYSFDIAEVFTLLQGHAAGLAALHKASQNICSGALEACIVGGVDTYLHPDTVEWLDANRQLSGAVSRGGFVPGEGAGFCLLLSDAACRRYGLGASVRITSAATGRETQLIKTNDVCLGHGLTDVVRHAVASQGPDAPTVDNIICDINAERYRGEEWGFVCLRLSQYFADPTAYVSPADCWGDMGAASGPLFAMLACRAAARGYAAGPRTLLWASSECGLRSAALLEAVAAA
jgi:3-oxoacyl-[acyl-carrier-protein] synthase-1